MNKDITSPLLSSSAITNLAKSEVPKPLGKNILNSSLMNMMKSKLKAPETEDIEEPDLTYSTDAIDFKKLLIQHKQRTERSLPFTL